MSTKKFGIVAGIALALSVVVSPAFAACSMTTLSECDNTGLMALIVQLLGSSSTTTTTTGTTITGIPAGFTFTTNLKQGSTGNDVKYLQILLNSDTATSVGNKGSETTYFGAMTKAAVVKFQNKYASEVLTPYGLSAGTGFFGTASRAKANALIAAGVGTGTGTGTGTVITGGFTVALAADNPVAGTFVQGQATADLAHYTFSNGTATPVKVTSLSLNRIGVSADTTLANVYLFNGATRITDAASVSAGKITFNASNGIFTIPANTTMTVAVKSDIAGSSSGQTIGVSLSSITSDGTLSSVLPIAGNISSIATATLAGVTVGTVAPSAATTVNAGTTNYTVFSAPLTISTRPVNLNAVTLKLIGSAPADAFANLKLYVNGINYGTVATIDANSNVVFSLATPVAIQSGSATLEVRGDIVKGSNRNFSFSIQNAADLAVTDSTYNVNITASGIPATTAIVSINSGVVSVTLDPTFSSTIATGGASNVTLAKYYFKAFGEDVKVSSLDVTPSINLDNVVVYVNGAPAVSNQNYTGTKLHFNLGSSLILPANTPVSVEVRADTKASGVNITTGTVTIALNVYANNAQGVSSSQLTTAPASAISGPTLTLSAGGLVLATASGVVDGSIVPNTSNQRLGSFVIQAGSSEAVKINNISVTLGGTLNVATLSNLYIKYGTTTSTPVNPQTTNNFSVDVTLQPNAPLTVEVYGDVGSMSMVANSANTQTFVNTDATPAADGVAAHEHVTIAGTWANADTATATINGFPSVFTATGADTTVIAAGLAAAINSNTNVNGTVIATNTLGVVNITARVAGTAGNSITLTASEVTAGNGTATAGAANLSGGTANTAQIDTSLPANVEIGDIFTVTINSTTFNYTATAATNKNVVEGLTALINASTAVNSIVTASEDDTTLTVTADVAGTAGAFTMTSSAANGTHTSVGNTVQVTLGMSATGSTSNSVVASVPATLAGQTMTVRVGSLSDVALTSYSPVAQFVIGGTTSSIVGSYNLKATNGSVTVDELVFTNTDANNTVSSITVNGVVGQVIGNTATLTGVNFVVPTGYAGADMQVKVDYNTVGLGGLASELPATIQLDSIKYHVGNSTTTLTTAPLPIATRTMTLVASKPTVELLAPSNTHLTNGTVELAKIKVTADSTGNIIMNTLPVTIATSGAVTITGTGGTTDLVVKDKNGSSLTISEDLAATIPVNNAGTAVVITFTGGYTIAAGTSETFSIWATAALSDGTGDSVSTTAAPSSSFNWQDVNGNDASITGTNILNYPTSSVTSSN